MSDIARLAYEASYAGTDPSCFTPWDELPADGRVMWARVVQAVAGKTLVSKDGMFHCAAEFAVEVAYMLSNVEARLFRAKDKMLERGDLGEALMDYCEGRSDIADINALIKEGDDDDAPPSDPAPERSRDQSTGGE